MKAKAPPKKSGGKSAAKSAPKSAAKSAAKTPDKLAAKAPPKAPRVAFPKKNQPPAVAEFAARLPLALGKRFEGVRSFLLKQKGVAEDVYFYGPKTGWALRYLHRGRPLCSLLIMEDRPLGLLSMEPAALNAIDWTALSDAARIARKAAHGSPSRLWLDVPLQEAGAGDFKALCRAKIATLPTLPPPPPPRRDPTLPPRAAPKPGA